jgi:DNA-binding NtrC family response regulator
MPYKAARLKSQEQFAREYLGHALAQTNGNVSAAARRSGIRRQYFQSRLTELGIEADAYRVARQEE